MLGSPLFALSCRLLTSGGFASSLQVSGVLKGVRDQCESLLVPLLDIYISLLDLWLQGLCVHGPLLAHARILQHDFYWQADKLGLKLKCQVIAEVCRQVAARMLPVPKTWPRSEVPASEAPERWPGGVL